jgi:hypothetical protein
MQPSYNPLNQPVKQPKTGDRRPNTQGQPAARPRDVGQGELTPPETDSPGALPDSARRAIGTNDLERRIEKIEERLEDAPEA